MATPVARRYSQALLAALKTHEDLERAERDLETLVRILHQLPSLGRVLAHPGVKPERKAALLDTTLSGLDCLPETRRLIAMLVEARLLPSLPEIAAHFRKLKDAKTAMVSVEVTTPQPVAEGERGSWETALASIAGSRVRIDYKTDTSLIGGAVARVGSVLYDGSVRGSLERIRQSLIGE